MSTVHITNFAGGITTDPREMSTDKFAITRNFDVFSSSHRLKPYPGMVADQVQAYYLTDFVYLKGGTGVNDNVLAYGVQSGQGITGRPEIYMKTGDILTSTWTTALFTPGTASLQRGSNNDLFYLYKGYLYFAVAGYISRVGNLETSGTGATATQEWEIVDWVTITQGVRHSLNDRMYFGYTTSTGAYVARNDNGTFTATLYTLPSDVIPTSVCEYGIYLAVAAKPKSGIGNSYVYLYDTSSSDITPQQIIDWGSGSLNVLENIDGTLVGISIIGNTVFDLTPKIIIKGYTGGVPQVINDMTGGASTITLGTRKYKQNNIVYFSAQMTLNGVNRQGIFAVGKNKDGRFIVTHDVLVNNDTEPVTINGFAKFSDVWFVAYNSDGSVNRTLTNGTYSGTSIWESLVNHSMPVNHRKSRKQLEQVKVMYTALSSVGQVVVKYRVDGGSYTTIFTDNTDGSTEFTMGVDANGTQFTAGRDYEFKIESTGGAIITGFTYKYSILESSIEE